MLQAEVSIRYEVAVTNTVRYVLMMKERRGFGDGRTAKQKRSSRNWWSDFLAVCSQSMDRRAKRYRRMWRLTDQPPEYGILVGDLGLVSARSSSFRHDECQGVV